MSWVDWTIVVAVWMLIPAALVAKAVLDAQSRRSQAETDRKVQEVFRNAHFR